MASSFISETLILATYLQKADRVYLAFSQLWKLLIKAENTEGLRTEGAAISCSLPPLEMAGGVALLASRQPEAPGIARGASGVRVQLGRDGVPWELRGPAGSGRWVRGSRGGSKTGALVAGRDGTGRDGTHIPLTTAKCGTCSGSFLPWGIPGGVPGGPGAIRVPLEEHPRGTHPAATGLGQQQELCVCAVPLRSPRG